MKVEAAIQRAIDGGWKKLRYSEEGIRIQKNGMNGTIYGEDWVWGITATHLPHGFPLAIALLDPSFWQSLGKALEWKPEVVIECACGRKERKKIFVYHWHRFIDHLANGKTAEEFFDELN